MNKFYLDTDALEESDKERLEGALEGIVAGDTDFALELILVDEEEIRRLNREVRGVDRVTDVLSFPSMDGIKGKPVLADEHGECIDEEGRIFLGSIVICEKRARKQAAEYGHSFERELWYLAVHGVLHCLGYDHETEEEKREMRAKEEEVMAKLDLTREEK